MTVHAWMRRLCEPAYKQAHNSLQKAHVLQVVELETLGACAGVRQIRAALGLWDGSGAFVFTSSTGVYAEDAGPCSEDGPLLAQGHSERTDRRGSGQ